MLFFFFFNDTATTEIYTLSLHDALPISDLAREQVARQALDAARPVGVGAEVDRERHRERVQAERGRGFGDAPRRRAVGRGSLREVTVAWGFVGIESRNACHVEQSLRLVVEGGEIPVANGPIDERLDLTWERASEREVINAQPERGGAVEDRLAADRLVGIHLDWAAVLVVEEGCAALVLSANEDGVRVPGGIVAIDPAAALEDEHTRAGLREA